MAGLTTHVLDQTHGRPAAGMIVRLSRDGEPVVETAMNADGRCDAPLLAPEALSPGRYRLEFDVGGYFRGQGLPLAQPILFETVAIEVEIAEAGQSHHVPLLVSPFGYSTYRGS